MEFNPENYEAMQLARTNKVHNKWWNTEKNKETHFLGVYITDL